VELEPDNRLATSLAEQMKMKYGANFKSVRCAMLIHVVCAGLNELVRFYDST
jgi:hypothetical protein